MWSPNSRNWNIPLAASQLVEVFRVCWGLVRAERAVFQKMEQITDGVSSLRMANEMNWFVLFPHSIFPLLTVLSEENCWSSGSGYTRIAVIKLSVQLAGTLPIRRYGCNWSHNNSVALYCEHFRNVLDPAPVIDCPEQWCAPSRESRNFGTVRGEIQIPVALPITIGTSCSWGSKTAISFTRFCRLVSPSFTLLREPILEEQALRWLWLGLHWIMMRKLSFTYTNIHMAVCRMHLAAWPSSADTGSVTGKITWRCFRRGTSIHG